MQHSWEDPETRLGTVTLLKQLLWPLAARNTLHVLCSCTSHNDPSACME